MLENDDFFSIRNLNQQDQKYSEECKKIISYVKSFGSVTAEDLLISYGKNVALVYISLCNSSAIEKESEERLKYCAKIRI